ncbi:hypothetical protein CYMTET_40075, partial [Cymbomonas tetramitiformis]
PQGGASAIAVPAVDEGEDVDTAGTPPRKKLRSQLAGANSQGNPAERSSLPRIRQPAGKRKHAGLGACVNEGRGAGAVSPHGAPPSTACRSVGGYRGGPTGEGNHGGGANGGVSEAGGGEPEDAEAAGGALHPAAEAV